MKQSLRLILLFIFSVSPYIALIGQTVIDVKSDAYLELPSADLLYTEGALLDINEAIAADSYESGKVSPFECPLGDPYWLRFKLYNSDTTSVDRIVYLKAVDFYEANLHQVSSSGQLIKIDSSGVFRNIRARNFKIERHTYLVSIPEQDTVTCYLYLNRKYLPSATEICIVDIPEYVNKQTVITFWRGLTISIGLIYFLAALLSLFVFGVSNVIHLCIYTLGMLIFLTYNSAEVPVGYLISSAPLYHWHDMLPYLGGSLAALGYLGVFKGYFNIQFYLPWLDKKVFVLQIIILALFIGFLNWETIVSFHEKALYYKTLLLAVCTFLSIFIMFFVSVYLYISFNRKDCLVFLIAFIPIVIVTVIIWGAEFRLWGLYDWFYNNGPAMAILYEGLVLSGFQLNKLFKERTQIYQSLQNERNQIVDDLHSGILPAMSLLQTINDSDIRKLDLDLSNKIEKIQTNVNDDIRSLMWVLTTKETRYLVETLAKIRETIRERIDERIDLEMVSIPELMQDDVEIGFNQHYHLYHLIKEAINNVAKHANATKVTFTIAYNSGELSFELKDNGVGFDRESNDTCNKGHGLGELSRRIKKLNGSLNIDSIVGHGTTISGKIPLVSIDFKNTFLLSTP